MSSSRLGRSLFESFWFRGFWPTDYQSIFLKLVIWLLLFPVGSCSCVCFVEQVVLKTLSLRICLNPQTRVTTCSLMVRFYQKAMICTNQTPRIIRTGRPPTEVQNLQPPKSARESARGGAGQKRGARGSAWKSACPLCLF